jgi:hypothetical protein
MLGESAIESVTPAPVDVLLPPASLLKCRAGSPLIALAT